MNLRHTPAKSESFEDLHELLAYHKLVLEDAYKMRDATLERIKSVKVKITCKHHKLKIGMNVYAFDNDDNRLSYLEGDKDLANVAEILDIEPNYDLEKKPHLVVKYLYGEKVHYGYNSYKIYSYWELIKD